MKKRGEHNEIKRGHEEEKRGKKGEGDEKGKENRRK